MNEVEASTNGRASRALVALLTAAFALIAAGCPPPPPPPADAEDATVVVDAAHDSSTAIDAITDVSLIHIPDGAVRHTLSVQFPPTAVAPSEQTTLCVQVPLGNDSPQLVVHGHISLAPGSHHLIVYRMQPGVETWTTPRACTAFSGVEAAAPAMMMAQSDESDLVMPDGVAGEIAANQVVRIEEHFLNLSSETIQGTGTITMDTIDPIDSVVRANMFFWGPLSIDVAPHTTGRTDFFHLVDPGVRVFALSTHQHHFGTLATVTQAVSATAAGTEVYRNTSWAEPRIEQFDPPLLFDGTTGVQLHCEWNNTSDQRVMWGESASTDEMCFVGGYYYPSHGFEYCIDDSCSTL